MFLPAGGNIGTDERNPSDEQDPFAALSDIFPLQIPTTNGRFQSGAGISSIHRRVALLAASDLVPSAKPCVFFPHRHLPLFPGRFHGETDKSHVSLNPNTWSLAQGYYFLTQLVCLPVSSPWL